jgi:hypothetical protein
MRFIPIMQVGSIIKKSINIICYIKQAKVQKLYDNINLCRKNIYRNSTSIHASCLKSRNERERQWYNKKHSHAHPSIYTPHTHTPTANSILNVERWNACLSRVETRQGCTFLLLQFIIVAAVLDLANERRQEKEINDVEIK